MTRHKHKKPRESYLLLPRSISFGFCVILPIAAINLQYLHYLQYLQYLHYLHYPGEGGPGLALCGDPAAAAGGLGGCAEHGGGHRQGGEAAQVRRSGQEARARTLLTVLSSGGSARPGVARLRCGGCWPGSTPCRARSCGSRAAARRSCWTPGSGGCSPPRATPSPGEL